MDSIVGKVMRPFVAVWRVIALTLFVCATGQAWAVTTTGYEDFGDTAGVVLWRGETAQANFHQSSVAAVASDGTVGAAGTMTWGQFCSSQGAYSSPGKVLVYDAAGYRASSDAQFSPLSLGGLWVKSLADTDAGTVYAITGTGTRATNFGVSGVSSLFKLEKSFTIDRQGAFTFNGTVNLEVAQDTVFSINASYPHQNITVPSGSALKTTGAGSITIGNTDNGLVVNGTLDLSAATRPAMTGLVKISQGSTLVLPAGTAVDSAVSIAICSGTLSVDNPVNVKIGSADPVTASLTVSGGSITLIETTSTYTATISGDTAFSSISWEKGGESASISDISRAILEISGSGTVTGLSSTPVKISIGSGVKFDATSVPNIGTVELTGAGTFLFTANYPATVPAGATCEYQGGAVAGSAATVSSVTVSSSATLKTTGFVTISSLTTQSSGTLEVVSGTTTASASGACALSGNLRIDAGATFVNGTSSDAVNYNGQGCVFTIYGTLDMGATRWSLRGKSKHEIKLYNGARITGSGDGNGALDWIENESTGQIDTYGDNVEIAANIRVRSGANVAFWVDDNATCTLSGTTFGAGTFSKSGANGTLKITGTCENAIQNTAGTIDVGASQALTITLAGDTAALATSNDAILTGRTTLSSVFALSEAQMTFFSDASKWRGTLVVPATTANQAPINLSRYANAQSTLQLNGLTGSTTYFATAAGNFTIPGTVKLGGTANFNNGWSGYTYAINSLADSNDQTLGLYAWNGANGNGVTYAINEFKNFGGTVNLVNGSGHADQNCVLTLNVGNIVVATPAYGTPLVKISTSVITPAGTRAANVNLSSATLNGVSAALVQATVNAVEGVYLAEATYGGQNYPTLAQAITAAGDDVAGIGVLNSAATIPSGYALVTAAGGAMTLRATGGAIYWAAANSGDWCGEDSNGTHTFYTADGATTPYVAGDTVVITNNTQIWSKTAAHGAKFQIGTDSVAAEVHFTRSGDHCDDYILDGSMVEIKSGSSLVAERYGLNGGTYTGWNSYNSHNGSEINNTSITGSGTFKIGGDTGGHGAAVAVLSGTSTIADTVTVEFADGATLSVPSESAFSGEGTVALVVTLGSDPVTVINFTSNTPSDTSKFSSAAALSIEDDALIAYAVASVTAADDSVTYCGALETAVGIASSDLTYKYVTILADMSFVPGRNIRYKIADGVIATPVASSAEYATPTANTPDVNGAVTYDTTVANPITYTWSGADSYATKYLGRAGNWTYDGGTTASRAPAAGDSLIVDTEATITVGADVTVAGITVSAAVTLTASTARTLTASDDGIVLTTAGASITTSNVTLSPAPTTNVARSRVVLTDSTYSVELIPGTIFSVY